LWLIGNEPEIPEMSLDLLAFPGSFSRLPFDDGAQIRELCDRRDLTQAGRGVVDAFGHLAFACSDLGGRTG